MFLRAVFITTILTLAVGSALAQPPSRGPCPTGCGPLPARGASPLLYLRFSGPAGMKAAFYQGRAPARTFPAPAMVGVRPGYIYRVKLSDFPDRPGVSVYPSIQVIGTLHLPPKMGASTHPATIHLTEADLDSVAVGALVTKVVYLEHPDNAEPIATRPDEIMETSLPQNLDLLQEARKRGRPMLIVHLGQRQPTPEELAQTNVPGTILMPGDRALSPAARPAPLAMVAPGFFDPQLGPRLPTEECLADGGDRGPRAAHDNQGRLQGVQTEDTVAEYTDGSGRRQVSASNRVCLCAPRYGVLRIETPLAAAANVQGLIQSVDVRRQDQMRDRVPGLAMRAVKQVDGLDGRVRPSANVNTTGFNIVTALKILDARHLDVGVIESITTRRTVQITENVRTLLERQLKFTSEMSVLVRMEGTEQVYGTSVIGRVENGPQVFETWMTTRDFTVCCGDTPPQVPDKPLMLVKCADKHSAAPGDIVTFTLRYSNQGGRPITDIAVTDSLSGRLEYVEGSSESDRDAVFTMQENEAGSLLLRWAIGGRLQPGQSGTLRFKARVR